MKFYIVSYDLHDDYEYTELHELLRRMNGVKLLESVWKLRQGEDSSCIGIHRRLSELTGIDWDFVVAEIAQTDNQPIILKGPIEP